MSSGRSVVQWSMKAVYGLFANTRISLDHRLQSAAWARCFDWLTPLEAFQQERELGSGE